jgi:DNA polymerase-1
MKAIRYVETQAGLPTAWTGPYIALDTETTGVDFITDALLLLAISDGETAYVIDARAFTPEVIHRLNTWFEGHVVIGHNIKFDYNFLYKHGIRLHRVMDTMLMEQIIHNGKPHVEKSLQGLIRKYVGVHLDKGIRSSFSDINLQAGYTFTQAQIEYAGKDVLYLIDLLTAMQAEHGDIYRRYGKLFYLEHSVLHCYADIERAGMKLDEVKWRQNYEAVLEKKALILEKLKAYVLENKQRYHRYIRYNLFGEYEISINWHSNKDRKEILTQIEGIENLEKFDTKRGKLRNFVDKESLQALQGKLQTPNRLIALLIELGNITNLEKTFGLSMLDYVHPVTKRMHASIFQLGAVSGRITSVKPNLLNIPADNKYRSCFIAEAGNKIISCDYSQIELKIMGYLSKEPAFLEAFRNEEDLHCKIASLMFNRKITKADKRERDIAKRFNFGVPYGAGPGKVAEMFHMPLKEVEAIYNTFKKSVPALWQFLEEAGRKAQRQCFSENKSPFKRFRFYTFTSEERKVQLSRINRLGKNWQIQTVCSDLVKCALIMVRKLLHANPIWQGKLINVIHDEIVVECSAAYAEAAGQQIKAEMEKTGKLFTDAITLTAEYTVDDYWKK